MDAQGKIVSFSLGVTVGIATFALIEIGIGLASFRMAGGYDNDMVWAAVIIFCTLASPFCLIAAVMAGLFARHLR
jgi:hypothetical protein